VRLHIPQFARPSDSRDSYLPPTTTSLPTSDLASHPFTAGTYGGSHWRGITANRGLGPRLPGKQHMITGIISISTHRNLQSA
jgi:hypothetical protein